VANNDRIREGITSQITLALSAFVDKNEKVCAFCANRGIIKTLPGPNRRRRSRRRDAQMVPNKGKQHFLL